MAAQRIRAANSSGLPRCKSEGTLIDLGEGCSETSFNDVKGESSPGRRTGGGRRAGCTASETQGLSLTGCQVHVHLIKSSLSKCHRIVNPAQEQQPLVLFCLEVSGGCFEFSPS